MFAVDEPTVPHVEFGGYKWVHHDGWEPDSKVLIQADLGHEPEMPPE
jgi:hypothetical protein